MLSALGIQKIILLYQGKKTYNLIPACICPFLLLLLLQSADTKIVERKRKPVLHSTLQISIL